MICIPAVLYLFLTLLILFLTMSFTYWNVLFFILWVSIMQTICYAGYPYISWVLLFVPFIFYDHFLYPASQYFHIENKKL
jgi:hypothetical protein